MGANWTDVRFDYDGSLMLARRLWSLADELDDLGGDRNRWGSHALSSWSGRFGEEFAGRVNDEVADLSSVAEQLRGSAVAWGQSWASAMNEQNRRLFSREVERVQDNRSFGDEVKGFFVGHDDLPPEPHVMGAPTPPHFAPTGSLTRY